MKGSHVVLLELNPAKKQQFKKTPRLYVIEIQLLEE